MAAQQGRLRTYHQHQASDAPQHALASLAHEQAYGLQVRCFVPHQQPVHEEVADNRQPVHEQQRTLHAQQHGTGGGRVPQRVSEPRLHEARAHVHEWSAKHDGTQTLPVQQVVHEDAQGVVLPVLQRHEHLVHHIVALEGAEYNAVATMVAGVTRTLVATWKQRTPRFRGQFHDH